jgi:hypothetical protein
VTEPVYFQRAQIRVSLAAWVFGGVGGMRTAHFIAPAVAFWLSIGIVAACDGCGCRGGPGYRGPDGHCVGWAKLGKVCGNPPTTRCAYEGLAAALAVVPASPGASAVTQSRMVPAVKPLAEVPPVTSNVQQAKVDGLGCVDEVTLQETNTCAATARSDPVAPWPAAR